MSEAVWLAILGPGGLAALIVGGVFAIVHNRKAKKRDEVTEVIRSQVQNSHGTNLRDDVDKIMALVARVEGAVTSVASDVRGIRKDIGRLDERDLDDVAELRSVRDALNRRIDELKDDFEDTFEVKKGRLQ